MPFSSIWSFFNYSSLICSWLDNMTSVLSFSLFSTSTWAFLAYRERPLSFFLSNASWASFSFRRSLSRSFIWSLKICIIVAFSSALKWGSRFASNSRFFLLISSLIRRQSSAWLGSMSAKPSNSSSDLAFSVSESCWNSSLAATASS